MTVCSKLLCGDFLRGKYMDAVFYLLIHLLIIFGGTYSKAFFE